MDILTFLMENSQVILMLLSILLAVIARYFGAKAGLLMTAMQSLVDLQAEFLNSIRDGVISQEELTQLLAKIDVASVAIKAALNAFIEPVPITEKFAIVFGASKMKGEIAKVNAQVQSMKIQRMHRH